MGQSSCSEGKDRGGCNLCQGMDNCTGSEDTHAYKCPGFINFGVLPEVHAPPGTSRGITWRRQPCSLTAFHESDGKPVKLGEQVAGHVGAFYRVSEGSICKLLDEAELTSYDKIRADPLLVEHVPKMFGVREINGDRYLELEDLQCGMCYETSGLLDLKIGYTTFRADAGGVTVPKEDYYQKAVKVYRARLTDEEHKLGKISKARWMTLNNLNSSTALHGFRVDGARIGDRVLELHQDMKNLDVLMALLVALPLAGLESAMKKICKLKSDISESDLFMTSDLYGSSILIVFDSSGQTKVKMVDIRNLTPREERRTHFVKPEELPLPCESTEDGYLSALDSLLTFFVKALGKKREQAKLASAAM